MTHAPAATPARRPAPWSIADIPPQTGRRCLITGGAGGLGYETARALAGAGADVILAGRSRDKGCLALDALRRELPSARLQFALLDLADLDSVAAAARALLDEARPLDVLVNNAGVMAPPVRRLTAQGFELQYGTNHLGHVALTAALLPLLRTATAPRVVTVSSIAHRRGRLDFDDLQAARGYRPSCVYAQSKLANLLFAFELQRRSDAGHWGLSSIAAHPGVANTALFGNGPGAKGVLGAFVARVLVPTFGQSAARGALPLLFAATAPDAAPGGYYGPDGGYELRGDVAPAEATSQARDARLAGRLWELSTAQCGARWPV